MIACPSTRLCLFATPNGRIFSSTDPARRGSWHRYRMHLHGHLLITLSCGTTHLCVAGDGHGDLYVSRRPTGGGRAWKHIRIAGFVASHPATGPEALACARGPVCITFDSRGRLFSSTHPMSARAWSSPRVFSRRDVTAVACSGRSLCVAGTVGGGLVLGRRRG